MSKLVWDQTGERYYETGVDHGVLYPVDSTGAYGAGVAWNGLTAVNENPSGGEASAQWADNIKYLNLISAEEFGFTIEAFTYPDEFAACDGSASPVSGLVVTGQKRKKFGFSYRTRVGNDVDGDDLGYKIHIVYGCQATPTDKGYATVNDSPEAINFSWEVSTTPAEFTSEDYKNLRPTAHLVIDSTKFTTEAAKAKLAALEDLLYGTDTGSGTAAALPTPDVVISTLS